MSPLSPSNSGSNDNSSNPQDEHTIDVTIRFSASLPDLPLSVSLTRHPHANTCTLKQLIRQSMPREWAQRRIRLICAGKALLDNDLLTSSLRRGRRGGGPTAWTLAAAASPASSPSRAPTPVSASSDKGKAPVRDPPVSTGAWAKQQPTVYIHCSIGDLTLPSEELEREARVASEGAGDDAAAKEDRSAASQGDRGSGNDGAAAADDDDTRPPPPRGFDRLLASGFSASEVASLRLQFLSIQSHTHTPDTMPSPTTLRSMEDAWLDGSESFTAAPAAAGAGAGAGAGPGAAGAGHEATEQSALDDMLLGTAMGFFWPIGCLLWGVREEGVWSTRRKMAVIVGVCLNVIIGLVKYSA